MSLTCIVGIRLNGVLARYSIDGFEKIAVVQSLLANLDLVSTKPSGISILLSST
jgi:hypothetical protein